MARETKTVQVYPTDARVNAEIKRQELFGWEVIGNQRIQEFARQDSDGTRHYETFNKITFSREKSAEWYNEIVKLEKEYLAIGDIYTNEKYLEIRYDFGYKCEVDKLVAPTTIFRPKCRSISGSIVSAILSLGALVGTVAFAVNEKIFWAVVCAILTICLAVNAVSRLGGLKGEEAVEAKKKYDNYLSEKKQYEEKCKREREVFLRKRVEQITTRAKKLVK